MEEARDNLHLLLDDAPEVEDGDEAPLLASFLGGHYAHPESVALSEGDDPFKMAASEAVDWFRAKGVVDSATFAAAEDDYKGNVFSVARVSDKLILDKIYNDLDKAVSEGTTFDDFINSVDGHLDRGPTNGKDDFYWETVFRNNTQSAYAAGRYQRQQANKKARPYIEYVAIMDDATRPAHRKFNGTILHIDHPFWATHTPINGHRCRCTTRSHNKASLELYGKTITKDEEIPELVPDPGFSGNPGTRAGANKAAKEARSGLEKRGLGTTGRDMARGNDPKRVKAIQETFPGGADNARAMAETHGRVFSPTAKPRTPKKGESLVEFAMPSQSPELMDRQLVKILQDPGLYPYRNTLQADTVVGVQKWSKAWRNPEVAVEAVGGSELGYFSQTRMSLSIPDEDLPHLMEVWRNMGTLKPTGLSVPSPIKARFPWLDVNLIGEGLEELPEGFGWAWRTLKQENNKWLEHFSVAPVTGADRVALNIGVIRYLESLGDL